MFPGDNRRFEYPRFDHFQSHGIKCFIEVDAQGKLDCPQSLSVLSDHMDIFCVLMVSPIMGSSNDKVET